MSAALAFAPAAKASVEAAHAAAPSLVMVKTASPKAARSLAALNQMYGYFGSDQL